MHHARMARQTGNLLGRSSEQAVRLSSRARCAAGQTSGATAVGPGDDLEVVTVVAEEVDAAASVVVVDLSRVALRGVGPVLHLALGDPSVDRVELIVADEERIVLREDVVAAGGREVEAHAVGGGDLPEVTQPVWLGETEQLG